MVRRFPDDPETEGVEYPVATHPGRLRRDMRKCGATEEEIDRIFGYLPHLTTKRKNKKPNALRGRGEAYAFLQALMGHQGDECVPWPFSRDDEGYGLLGYNSQRWKAHRLMCQLSHGEPPSPEHTAAHLCGKGHEGCVNPKHLQWKTQSENLADRKDHVLYRGGRRAKLTPRQVQYIKDMRGRIPQRQLAAELGVTTASINRISTGRKWRPAATQPQP